MGRIGLGIVPMVMERPAEREGPRWRDIRSAALLAEEAGFDTVWIPDELLWDTKDWPEPRGWWECVATLGAVSEATSTIQVGSWVLSALHRNPALTARVVETLDEISDGRLLFGYGSGHAGRQAEAFGFPADLTVGRYEEALQIIVPLLRDGEVDFAGDHHRATRLVSRPRGPRPGAIPLLLGGHGPRTMRLAVEHADIWSGFATEGQAPDFFEDMLARLDQITETQERDPATLGKSIGIDVLPPGETDAEGMGTPLAGTIDELAAIAEGFADIGCTRLELFVIGDPVTGVERLAPLVERVKTI